MARHHSGFSVHAGNAIAPDDPKIKAPADGPVVLDHSDDGRPGYVEFFIIYR